MNNGWISLHRKFLDSNLFSYSGNTVKVSIYLLISANHAAKFYRGIEIQRGQCVRSLSQISDSCHLSRKAVRYALDQMLKTEFITIDEPFGAQQGHRITICKYDTYQSESVSMGTEGSNEGSNEGNTNNNNNNENNENRYGDSAESPSLKKKNLYTENFETFWKLYGVGNKAGAFQAWKKQKINAESFESILRAVPIYKAYCLSAERSLKDGQGWLNGRFWETEWTHEAQGTKPKGSGTMILKKELNEDDWK